jgi:RNase adaptor protein for sRNA GlmZ degradation
MSKHQVKLVSSGFKYGPPQGNHTFDVSFAANPARREEFGGLVNAEVTPALREFVLQQDAVQKFLELLIPLARHLVEVDGGVVIECRCNRGKHRSQVIVDELARRLRDEMSVVVEHHDPFASRVSNAGQADTLVECRELVEAEMQSRH